ncbi:hypothetical protein [Streptomyces sp. NPDC094032]|uniref:hypothetical protein n=1 Tax=Streptomyces sp. NPDC094032 TaxID=3155308 RepID=UPI0033181782
MPAFTGNEAGSCTSGRGRNTRAAVASLAVVGLTWATVVDLDVVDRTLSIGRADDAQEAAVKAAVHDDGPDSRRRIRRARSAPRRRRTPPAS